MSWAQQLMDYMVFPGETATNYCKAAALGAWDFSQGTDVPAGTVPWGCACQADGADNGVDSDAAWAKCYAADQDRPIMQDDGTEKDTFICEFATVVKACKWNQDKQGPFPGGIWLGGLKHQMISNKAETFEGKDYLCVQANARGEKGYQIVCTDPTASGKACLIMAHYQKDEGYTAGMARVVALEFAKWLVEQGTDKSF